MRTHKYIAVKNGQHHTTEYLEDAYRVAVFLWGKSLDEWKIYRYVPMDGLKGVIEIENYLTNLESKTDDT